MDVYVTYFCYDWCKMKHFVVFDLDFLQKLNFLLHVSVFGLHTCLLIFLLKRTMVIMTRIQSLYVGMFVFIVWCVFVRLYYFHKHSLYLFNFFTYEFFLFVFQKHKFQIFCHVRPCRSFKIFWSKAEWPKLDRKRVQYISQTGAIQQIFFGFLFCVFCVYFLELATA